MIVKDLVAGVISKLRGRDDLSAKAPLYIRKALIELGQNYEFEKLKVTGPITNFKTNVSEYPRQGTQCKFINDGDAKITHIASWFIWYTNSTPIPGVDTGFELKYRNLRVVEPMSKILGIPTFYSEFGDKIIIGFLPDQTYATQMRYQKQHPFPAVSDLGTPSVSDIASLNSQEVKLPDDWQDIIEYFAAEKALDDVGMTDVASLYHQRLFGYKDKLGNEKPGLITVKLTQQERLVENNERQLRPVIRRYTR